jgi:phospho-N-acetylmuramoyl-pentapeptide-transferase
MLYYLHYLTSQSDLLGPLNVFQYVSFRAMGAAATSMLFSLLLGPLAIRLLTRLKLGQPLRTKDEVRQLADLHAGKKGTPTMGGLLIIASVVLSCLLWALPSNPMIWLVLVVFISMGAVGYADDFLKVRKKNSKGVSGRVKLAAQAGLALLVVLVLYHLPATAESAPRLEIPFYKTPIIWDLGYGGGFVFFSLVLMGTSNGVNLTDGLDGLAAGCTVTVALVYAVFAYLTGTPVAANYLHLPFVSGAEELAVFCAALAGGGLGFLWFNCHPAQVFMGDTGSLAIGGALGVVAICLNQELLLIVAGGVFVMEAGSVLLQVASFKLTGKRIFAMSPLHHHFELKGWNESTVTIRFWILSLLFALMALSTLKLR